jgi:PKD repeat protein
LHTYKTSGFYAVSLTALGIGGAIDVIKDKYIFVSACNNQPIRIGGTNYYYQKIQDALESSLLSGDVVQMLALDRPEAINLQQNVSIVLSGGYSCDYVSHLGFTTINGSLTIKDGKATVENLIIK